MKFACYTLGCKVNQYETQAMEQLLVQSGHTLGSFDEVCDGYIINTCSHFMPSELFVKMLRSAALDAGVELRQIEARQQAPDHPILWNVPETDDNKIAQIYVGQTRNGVSRLDDHNRSKDFWNKAIMFLADNKTFSDTFV